METSFEARLRQTLSGSEKIKSDDCPDTAVIGFFIEGKLPEQEANRLRTHISSCIYCLEQVSEMRTLLYCRDKWAAIPYRFLNKLENLSLSKTRPERKKPVWSAKYFFDRIGSIFFFPVRHWRYAAVCAVSVICTVFAVGNMNNFDVTGRMNILSTKGEVNLLPEINPDTFVDVRVTGSGGNVLRSVRGVIVDPKGMVVSSLSPLVGATSVKVMLRNGRSYEIKSLWKDDGKNIALMKIEDDSLPYLKAADLKQVGIGDKAFTLADSSNVKDALAEAVISDFKTYAGRRSGGDVRYIQFASFTTEQKRGVLLDREGRLIGLTITEEKSINLAAPLNEAFRLTKTQKPVAVSELKNINYSGDALSYYFKGIIARNAQKQDEAIENFKKAIELNPNLESVHLELGFLYYKKRLFDLEKREYEEALRINPDNTDAMFYLATNLETRGLYEDAAKIFERIVVIDPEDVDAYYELGLAYLARGQREKVVDVCNVLQKLDLGLAGKLRAIALKR